jgi:hypothetical protein
MTSSADRLQNYTQLLARESDAWARLRASQVDEEYDPLLLAAWLEAGRRCSAARQVAGVAPPRARWPSTWCWSRTRA